MVMNKEEAELFNALVHRVNQLTDYVTMLDHELHRANTLTERRGFRFRNMWDRWLPKEPLKEVDRTPEYYPRTSAFDAMDDYEMGKVSLSRKVRPKIEEVITFDPTQPEWEDVEDG